MRAPASQFQTSIAADAFSPIWLVELQASTVIRYAFYATDITFDGDSFSANSGRVGIVEQSLEGQAPRLTLTIQNLDRVIRDWLDTADRRGTDVVVRLVMADNLSDGDAALEDTYEIDTYAVDDDDAVIECGASPILGGIQVPGRRLQTWFCPWTYKGTECGYTGDLKTCDFTYDGKNGCTKHFGKTEAKRFGGFIGKPQDGLVVA
jgi:lambda family phage minor tail protein L